jgi:hypothetical protein
MTKKEVLEIVDKLPNKLSSSIYDKTFQKRLDRLGGHDIIVV